MLGDIRDKLYNTRERMRQLLANGKSDINIEDTFTDASQVPSQTPLTARSLIISVRPELREIVSFSSVKN